MRALWQKFYSLELAEVFVPFLVPDATIEPAPKFNIMGDTKSAAGCLELKKRKLELARNHTKSLSSSSSLLEPI